MNILKTEIQAKAGIELFYNNCKSTENNYELLHKELNRLNKYLQEYANSKNNRVNKVATAFKMYFLKEAPRKRDTEQIEKIGKCKRLSFKKSYRDYREEFLILRFRNYSYRDISIYSKKHFKVKVSKDTIRNFIKEFE